MSVALNVLVVILKNSTAIMVQLLQILWPGYPYHY